MRYGVEDIEILFQFQHGAIKSLKNLDPADRRISFQFQHGAIKSEIRRLFDEFIIISIPTWCD